MRKGEDQAAQWRVKPVILILMTAHDVLEYAIVAIVEAMTPRHMIFRITIGTLVIIFDLVQRYLKHAMLPRSLRFRRDSGSMK